jgi:hypothetical protein
MTRDGTTANLVGQPLMEIRWSSSGKEQPVSNQGAIS